MVQGLLYCENEGGIDQQISQQIIRRSISTIYQTGIIALRQEKLRPGLGSAENPDCSCQHLNIIQRLKCKLVVLVQQNISVGATKTFGLLPQTDPKQAFSSLSQKRNKCFCEYVGTTLRKASRQIFVFQNTSSLQSSVKRNYIVKYILYDPNQNLKSYSESTGSERTLKNF